MIPADVGQGLVEVLLVEDTPRDLRLTKEAFRDFSTPVRMHLAADDVEAMSFLRRDGTYVNAPRPDLILLDLCRTKMSGLQVLNEIKTDQNFKSIPTIILTTSDAEADLVTGYELQADCCLRKPEHWDALNNLIRIVNAFRLTDAKLPQQTPGEVFP